MERSSPGPSATPSKVQPCGWNGPPARDYRRENTALGPESGGLHLEPGQPGRLRHRPNGVEEGRDSAGIERKKGSPRVSPYSLPAPSEKLGGEGGRQARSKTLGSWSLPRGWINKLLSAQYTIASLDGDEESLQRRWRQLRRRGARAGAQPWAGGGRALARLTSVFLFRALFISPPPAALRPEQALEASASSRCFSRVGVTGGRSSGTPAPRAAARRHRGGRGPGEGTHRPLQAARRRLSPPSASASAARPGPGRGVQPLPPRARPGAARSHRALRSVRARPAGAPGSAAPEAQTARKLLLQCPALLPGM